MLKDTMPALFVTGATGFLGRHFMYWQRNEPVRFVVLVRAQTPEKGLRRFLEGVKAAFDCYGETFDLAAWMQRTTIVTGDICDPCCGLTDEAVASLADAGIRQFWHFAASLNFEEKSQGKIWSQNVEGTANVLDLVQRIGVSEFIHCSTAYSVGKSAGMIEEVIHPLPRTFNNLYEESKCLAEHEVRRFCDAHGVKWAILRPSIVIGPRATKGTGGSTTGLYGFLGNLFKNETTLRSIRPSPTILGNKDTRLNLVPVDDLMQDIQGMTRTGIESGSILHLTSRWYPDIEQSLLHISQLMGIEPLRIAKDTGAPRSPVEQVLDRRTQFHSAYLDSEMEFRRSLPRRYGVDTGEFAAFITQAYREAGEEVPEDAFSMAVMESFDGTPIRVFSAGDPSRPAVLLVNAIGMPAEFWSGFSRQLAKNWFVLTWETRGCPNVDLPCDLERHAFFDHVRDLLSVLDHFGVEAATLIGWCSGAQVALRTAAAYPRRVSRVVSINGSFGGSGDVEMTQFEAKLREVMPKIASDRRVAEIYYNVVHGNPGEGGAVPEELSEKSREASAVLTSVDPALLHLTSRPFETVESLFRYSRLISASLAEDVTQWIGDVRAPVLLHTGKRDLTAHFECTRKVAGQLAAATLQIDDEGDHFSFYRENGVPSAVGIFIQEGVRPALGGAS